MTRTLFFEITDRCNHACFYCCKSFRGQPGITMNSGALDKVLSLPASGLALTTLAFKPLQGVVPARVGTGHQRRGTLPRQGVGSLCAGTGDRPRGDQHQLVLLDA